MFEIFENFQGFQLHSLKKASLFKNSYPQLDKSIDFFSDISKRKCTKTWPKLDWNKPILTFLQQITFISLIH